MDKRKSAAEDSIPEPKKSKKQAKKKPRTNRPKDPVKTKAGKASAAARRAKREKGDPVTRPCSARRTNGEPCKNSAIRGGTVCARHGGSAPQVRAKANQRLIEMVLPAMKELHRILDSKDTADADKLRAISMVLNRTGYNEKHTIDLGLREPTPFDALKGSLVILRGEGNVLDPADRPSLGSGVGDENDPEALNRHARLNANRGAADAETYLPSNDDADIVMGQVVSSRDSLTSDDGLMGFPQTNAQRRAKMRPTEHDPAPHHDPDERPYARYEANIRRRIEDR